jgi:hypothetical protein
MRSAREGIIQSNNVAGADLRFGERGGDGHRHRPQVDGHVIALRDDAAP